MFDTNNICHNLYIKTELITQQVIRRTGHTLVKLPRGISPCNYPPYSALEVINLDFVHQSLIYGISLQQVALIRRLQAILLFAEDICFIQFPTQDGFHSESATRSQYAIKLQ